MSEKQVSDLLGMLFKKAMEGDSRVALALLDYVSKQQKKESDLVGCVILPDVITS